jgi:hypothetical protein
MDFIHGVLLFLIGLPVTFLVFFVITWAEKPEVDKDADLNEVQKSIRDLFKP